MILAGTPVAKATHWVSTDAETRKPGEQTGLDTPVVLAVNAEYSSGATAVAPDLEIVKYSAWGVWSQG